jgi:hypothetical protein
MAGIFLIVEMLYGRTDTQVTPDLIALLILDSTSASFRE